MCPPFVGDHDVGNRAFRAKLANGNGKKSQSHILWKLRYDSTRVPLRNLDAMLQRESCTWTGKSVCKMIMSATMASKDLKRSSRRNSRTRRCACGAKSPVFGSRVATAIRVPLVHFRSLNFLGYFATRFTAARSAILYRENAISTPTTCFRLGCSKKACTASFPVPMPKSYNISELPAARNCDDSILETPSKSTSPYNKLAPRCNASCLSALWTHTCPSV
mmetsp:Transcript_49099/g.72947  ORF Transcript_49099/g.72947 Transcript_49099/m.72947 type:complete len:220 (+) Transcript_49099:356-1015(+)